MYAKPNGGSLPAMPQGDLSGGAVVISKINVVFLPLRLVYLMTLDMIARLA